MRLPANLPAVCHGHQYRKKVHMHRLMISTVNRFSHDAVHEFLCTKNVLVKSQRDVTENRIEVSSSLECHFLIISHGRSMLCVYR